MDSELEGFLNLMGEAERAGGRVLHELTALARSAELRELLKKVGHDEGYYAGELAAQVRRLGGKPSNRTGDFVEKVRAVPELRAKLELLNRGQRWVTRKINEQIASIADDDLKAFRAVLVQGHETNIGALDAALARGLA